MSASNSNRDARRRRILQGSQDRLALITGRLPNLPPTSSPHLPSDSIASEDDDAADADAASQPLANGNPDPNPYLSDYSSVSEKEADKTWEFTFPPRPVDQAVELNQGDSLVVAGGNQEEPFLQSHPSSTPGPASGVRVRVRSEASSSPQMPSFSVAGPKQLLSFLVNLFFSVTPQQLSSAVSATELIRLYCSCALGLLVLLSYVGFPVIGSRMIKSVILFRPFILLLVTNITLIAAHLLSELKRHGKDQDENKLFGQDGYGWVGDVGRALEAGLMLHNVMGSLFVDFSVYVIIIICGICLF